MAITLLFAMSAIAYEGYVKTGATHGVNDKAISKGMANNLKLDPAQVELWNFMKTAQKSHKEIVRKSDSYLTTEERRNHRQTMSDIQKNFNAELNSISPNFTEVNQASKKMYNGKSPMTFSTYIDSRTAFFQSLSPSQRVALTENLVKVKRNNRRSLDF
jgi:hypothetical protein